MWDSEPFRVFATQTDGREAEAPLLVEASLFAVSRSGDLAVATVLSREYLIVRGRSPSSPRRGTPREVLEDVTAADRSADGRLAVIRSVGGRTRLEFPIGMVLYQTAGWLS
jgi:hypothetical protein